MVLWRIHIVSLEFQALRLLKNEIKYPLLPVAKSLIKHVSSMHQEIPRDQKLNEIILALLKYLIRPKYLQ